MGLQQAQTFCSGPQANGVRVADEPWVADFERLIRSSKIVPATSEHGHYGPRIRSVLTSDRALLVLNDDPAAYRHLGLIRCARPPPALSSTKSRAPFPEA